MPSTASKQPSGAASTPVTRTPSRCGTGPVAHSATTAGAVRWRQVVAARSRHRDASTNAVGEQRRVAELVVAPRVQDALLRLVALGLASYFDLKKAPRGRG